MHEQRVRRAGFDAPERLQHQLLFFAHRAARHDHRPAGIHAEISQHAVLPAPIERRRTGHLERIEFQAAGHDDVRRIGADVDDAPRRLFRLHAEAVDVAKHPSEKRPRELVARVRPRRDAAVHHHRRHVHPLALPQQVRPDLGFHHHEEPRLHQPQRPPDDEREIERKIKHGIDVLHVAARDLLPRHRRRREKDPQRRIPPPQIGNQRAHGHRLADRHGVNPDRVFAVEIERHGQIAHPLPEAADVLLVADRLVRQIRRHDHAQNQDEQAVEDVHVCGSFVPG